MRILQSVVALTMLAAPAAAQKNDWLIVPGQRVGPITAATTRADLDSIFGKENVQERNLDGSVGPEAATVVYSSDASAALAITWDRERPASIRVCFGTQTGPCRWRTSSGIHIGTSIRELNALNGKSFQIGGFAQERGRVISWKQGGLEEDPAACVHLVVGLAPAAMIEGRSISKNEKDEWKQMQGDKPFSHRRCRRITSTRLCRGWRWSSRGPVAESNCPLRKKMGPKAALRLRNKSKSRSPAD